MLPGVNCSVLGCGSCRRSVDRVDDRRGSKGEAHQKKRNEWLGEVTKAREIDQDFREQIKKRQSSKMKDPRILKHVSIALFSVQL